MHTKQQEPEDAAVESAPEHFSPDDTDEAIALLAGEARKRIAAQRATADELATEAQRAQRTFEAQPSIAAHAEAAVRAQQAKNAAAAVRDLEADFAPLFAEETRRAQIKRLAELRATTDARAEAEAVGRRVVEIYATFLHELQDQVGVLARAVESRAAALAELNNLEKRVGDGRKHDPLSFPYAFDIVQRAVVARFGPMWGDHHNYGDGSGLRFVDHLNRMFVDAGVRFNVKINHRVL